MAIINKSFDSILGSNSGGSSEERNLKNDYMDAWQHVVRKIFYLSTGSPVIIILKISIFNSCAAPMRAPVLPIQGRMSVNTS